jgi:hypothetical protein
MSELSPASLAEVGAALAAALDAQREYERVVEAKAVILPEQREIDFGSTWLRYYGRAGGCPLGHQVLHFHWGIVWGSDEYLTYLRRQGWWGAALNTLLTSFLFEFQCGWRFSLTRCDVDGELGLERTHLAGMLPVQEGYYRAAEVYEFKGYQYRDADWFASAFREYTEGAQRQSRAVGRDNEEGGDQVFVGDEGQ